MNKNKTGIYTKNNNPGRDYCNLCENTNLDLLYSLKSYNVVQCRNCGLRFRTDRPSLAEAKILYDDPCYLNSNLFSNWKIDYSDDSVEVSMFREGLLILDSINDGKFANNENRKILDLGCARGIFLDLARRYGWEPVGVDLSPYAAEFARKNFGLSVHTGTLEEACFPYQYFDAVTMWDVIEHLEDPLSVLKEVLRVLKPGGMLLIMTPNDGSLISFIGYILHLVSFGLFAKPIELLYDIHHNYYFSEHTLKMILMKTGFVDNDFYLKRYPACIERWHTVKIGFLYKLVANILDYVAKLFHLDYRVLICARKCRK